MLRRTILAAALLLPSAAPAALDAFYLGTWRIVSSRPAPWIDPASAPEHWGRLLGRKLTFAAGKIRGPELGCKGPNYAVKDYPPDMLFQGNLTDPATQAAALGYGKPAIVTLETGCDGAVDFHFLDEDHALFALDNRLYRLERVRR